jgi:hypothetical protein
VLVVDRAAQQQPHEPVVVDEHDRGRPARRRGAAAGDHRRPWPSTARTGEGKAEVTRRGSRGRAVARGGATPCGGWVAASGLQGDRGAFPVVAAAARPW